MRIGMIKFNSKSRVYRFLFGIVFIGFGCSSSEKKNPWVEVTSPTLGPAQSVGSYQSGCLAGAGLLKLDGEGYRVMKPSRRRFYGHPGLITFVEDLGKWSSQKGWGPVLIGDLSLPRGGPVPGSHQSHQIGLDVDVWFRKWNDNQLNLNDRENLKMISVVDSEKNELDLSLFSEREVSLLKYSALNPEVDRVFVDPSIKRWLCRRFPQESWIGKIRPWWHHSDHFHIRLKCPLLNLDCKNQAPLTMSTGCDETLDWWFSEEAKKLSAVPESGFSWNKDGKFPEKCDEVLMEGFGVTGKN